MGCQQQITCPADGGPWWVRPAGMSAGYPRVRSTPEFGLLAEHVSTAQARSAGGQRHFRPPGARYHAPITMRASAPGQVGYCTTVASHVRVKTIQVSPNLGQDSEKLGDVSKCPKTYRATSCKRSCNELQEDCVRCLFVSYYLSLGSKRRQSRRPFVFTHATLF